MYSKSVCDSHMRAGLTDISFTNAVLQRCIRN